MRRCPCRMLGRMRRSSRSCRIARSCTALGVRRNGSGTACAGRGLAGASRVGEPMSGSSRSRDRKTRWRNSTRRRPVRATAKPPRWRIKGPSWRGKARVRRPTREGKSPGVGEGMAIRIGTSGFIYEHWRHRFYPPSARGSELEQYACTFDTVELNVTFYRMPPTATFRSWAARVPDGFPFRRQGEPLPDPRSSAAGAARISAPVDRAGA